MISLSIPHFKYREHTILKGIDLQFEEGHTYGIVGLNGSGKTTFFKLMAGFLKEEGVRVTKDGQALQRKDIGFMDTDLFFYPRLTAREFLSVFPTSNTSYNEEKLAALFRFPLDGFMEEFSTGMKKKLLLQSLIRQNKSIYILDEPFNGLDLETNKLLEVIVAVLNERGKTVFISSHILDPLLQVCTQIHYLKDQGIHRSYSKNEFGTLQEDLFGNYTREVKEQLARII